MSILDDLVSRIADLERRLDRLADTEIVPFDIGCRVYNSGNISISSGAVTDITFDSEYYDTDSMHSTTVSTRRITFNTAGKYLIIGEVRMDATSGGRRQIKINLNATTDIAIFEYSSVADATGVVHMVVSTVYKMAADDYVKLQVFQNSGGSINVTANSDYSPTFMATRLA